MDPIYAQYISDISSLDELASKISSDIKESAKKGENIQSVYLSRKGLITGLFSILNEIEKKTGSTKREIGQVLNDLKKEAESQSNIKDTSKPKNSKALFDPTFFQIGQEGKLHVLTREKILTEELFMRMGFSIIDDTFVDSDFNVFESLNVPTNHPARDLWDTFWTESGEVVRTQTTAFQNHLLVEAKENNSFPIRAIQPGLCSRNEATDARHEHTFYQVDGLYVSKNSEKRVSVVDLISTLKTFFSQYLQKEMKIRIQPAYFPFVEPGFEFAISCIFCKGEGCNVCSRSGWLEIGGCGMTHPNVFKKAGLDPDEYSGFAFGYGLERMAQLKLNINDVRLFRENDIRFLNNS